MNDRWLPERWRRIAGLARAEARLATTYGGLLADWITRLRHFVIGAGRQPDPIGVFATVPWFAAAVDDVVDTQVTAIIRDAHDDTTMTWTPDAQVRTYRHIEGTRNRLKGVPDTVFSQLRGMTMKSASEGWSMDELAGQIDGLFQVEGVETWRNRAMVIARTEAISAYNAGTFSGFLSQAQSAPGSWEKMWLATRDERTRPTHAHSTGADGQRVALLEPFKVGQAHLMYPGDPSGPPQEVIQCRCSLILLREGEAFTR